MAAVIQRGADRADHAVDHARRRDDVGAGLGMNDRRALQQFERQVVQQVALLQGGIEMLAPGRLMMPQWP